MNAAQITIGVELKDGNSIMGISFVGDESQLLPLLGAITHAQSWVNNRISQRVGEGTWDRVNGIQKIPVKQEDEDIEQNKSSEYHTEQELPRDQAIEATKYAIDAMNLRIEAMKKSPATSKFTINHSLLSKL